MIQKIQTLQRRLIQKTEEVNPPLNIFLLLFTDVHAIPLTSTCRLPVFLSVCLYVGPTLCQPTSLSVEPLFNFLSMCGSLFDLYSLL